MAVSMHTPAVTRFKAIELYFIGLVLAIVVASGLYLAAGNEPAYQQDVNAAVSSQQVPAYSNPFDIYP